VPPGRAYYVQSSCRGCHKIGEEGRASGPDLTYVGFRHGKDWLELWLRDPSAWKKDSAMPSPRLSPTARQAVVEYLSTLQGQDFKIKPWLDAPDSAAKGRLIYRRAGCIACHGPAGRGGFPNNNVPGGLVPALARTASTFTKEELMTKIRKGARPQKADPNAPAPLIEMPAWGQKLDEAELSALADYLLSLTPAGPADAGW
jgi:mono/diheme cytochrome c family protein